MVFFFVYMTNWLFSCSVSVHFLILNTQKPTYSDYIFIYLVCMSACTHCISKLLSVTSFLSTFTYHLWHLLEYFSPNTLDHMKFESFYSRSSNRTTTPRCIFVCISCPLIYLIEAYARVAVAFILIYSERIRGCQDFLCYFILFYHFKHCAKKKMMLGSLTISSQSS